MFAKCAAFEGLSFAAQLGTVDKPVAAAAAALVAIVTRLLLFAAPPVTERVIPDAVDVSVTHVTMRATPSSWRVYFHCNPFTKNVWPTSTLGQLGTADCRADAAALVASLFAATLFAIVARLLLFAAPRVTERILPHAVDDAVVHVTMVSAVASPSAAKLYEYAQSNPPMVKLSPIAHGGNCRTKRVRKLVRTVRCGATYPFLNLYVPPPSASSLFASSAYYQVSIFFFIPHQQQMLTSLAREGYVIGGTRGSTDGDSMTQSK